MEAIVRQLAALRHRGCDVALVSSGAVGVGMEVLGWSTRPAGIPDLQMAAAVGQSRLMARYDELFSAENVRIGQMLLTHDGLRDRERHLNARNTMMNLFRHGIVPIINENDVVSTEEIKFGDNDMLAALVSILIPADVLILLTTADGLEEPAEGGNRRRIPYLPDVTDDIRALSKGKASPLSTGGMATKLDAAQTASRDGIPVVIADGTRPTTILDVLAGHDVGTLLDAAGDGVRGHLTGRKRWIAFFHRARGELVIDDGACSALIEKGKSLLPIGIREVHGQFPVGSLVNVRSIQGRRVARGLVDFSSADIERIRGKRSSDIETILGSKDYEAVIHRDNLVLVD
jgi:glutamate 5-kinase